MGKRVAEDWGRVRSSGYGIVVVKNNRSNHSCRADRTLRRLSALGALRECRLANSIDNPYIEEVYWSNVGSGEHAYTKIWGKTVHSTAPAESAPKLLAMGRYGPGVTFQGYHAHVDIFLRIVYATIIVLAL